ncbi:hypothetical protein CRE_15748 [Caenorhabditis remanei]|uniref:HTH CENPB-type domain-containing protein n=1 Tax=Caenorhabditis remanei TaxID=31234 RepID=E3NHE4_CAERE|nr:hypothetical protein CRE_15748 [Caenorhabditis remanei]
MSADRILDYCTSYWRGLSKRPKLDEQEQRAATAVLEILNAAEEGDFQINSEEFFTEFEDDARDISWTPGDEVYDAMKVYDDVIQEPGKPNMIQFSLGKFVELDKVEEAVKYYGSKKAFNNNGSKARPPLETMKKLFRFIKDTNLLKKLRNYEQIGSVKFARANNLQFLSEELKKEVTKHLHNGKILHDATLRFLIAEIRKKHNLEIQNFEASDTWIAKWKRGFGLSSRKITKFVARIRHKNKDQMEKDSKKFVRVANREMASYPLSNVFNADQSGFQLEMHTGRTLAFTGSKDVPCVVQNVSSTTHSYTVMPLIAADGTLHNKLFVTLKERNGRWPKNGHWKADNLVVTCHTSHIMTKNLMRTFFEKVVFDSSMPDDILLCVDSWGSWKDGAAIDSVKPPSHKLKIMIIPPGCTGSVQPCDVGIFGGIKKVVKTVTGYAQLTCPDHKLFSRDQTLKLKDWARNAWAACGYDVPRPPFFKTPAEELFPRDVARPCDEPNCTATSMIRCLYCDKYFCFKDMFIKFHEC